MDEQQKALDAVAANDWPRVYSLLPTAGSPLDGPGHQLLDGGSSPAVPPRR